MPKTDKELTAEITIAFIESWNAKKNTTVFSSENISDLIVRIYTSLSKLESK